MYVILHHISVKYLSKQESIPVGCVPPACQLNVLWWPPLGVSTQGVGIPGPMSRGRWIYIPTPTPQTYQFPRHTPLDIPSPTPRHTHPMNLPLGHTHSTPGHIPPQPLDISIPSPPLGRDLGLGIPIPLMTRHTPEKLLPSRNYCCGR